MKNWKKKVKLLEEWVITTKSGEKKPLSISTSIVKQEDGKVHVLAIIQDIAQRKKSEEALRESEEKYRPVLAGIRISYLECRVDSSPAQSTEV